jgi:tetratricopeptide (TPR) repeat protein
MSRYILLAIALLTCTNSFAQKKTWKDKLAEIEQIPNDSIKASELNDLCVKISGKNIEDAKFVAEKIKAISPFTAHAEGEYLQAIAVIYRRKKEYKTSIEYFKKAIQKYQTYNNFDAIVNSEATIGVLLYESDNKKEGLAYFQKSIETAKKSGIPEIIDDAYAQYSGCLANAGDYAGKLRVLN